MNSLTTLGLCAVTALTASAWLQSSITETKQETQRLTQKRQELLAQSNNSPSALPAMGDDAEVMQTQHGDAAFTPELEGWWPESRPYFYLRKTYLPMMKFGRVHVPVSEYNALQTQRAKALNPAISSVELTSPSPDGMEPVTLGLFEAGNLNPNAAALLGMTDSERDAVSRMYSGLFSDIRELERRRVERINDGGPVVARIPNLSDDVNPMLSTIRSQLEQLVGPTRAGILTILAKDYAQTHLDGMGLQPREFARSKQGGISVKVGYIERWQPMDDHGMSPDAYNVASYPHLFGPGAPCELNNR